jgi:hypothetical protein
MTTRRSLIAVAIALSAAGLPAPAQPQAPPAAPGAQPAGKGPEKASTARRSQLPGDELFTPEERRAFFDRMKAAQTPEERAKLQAERRATAETRAKEKGVALPPPPAAAPKSH